MPRMARAADDSGAAVKSGVRARTAAETARSIGTLPMSMNVMPKCACAVRVRRPAATQPSAASIAMVVAQHHPSRLP